MFTKGKVLACLVGIAPLLLTTTAVRADETLTLKNIISLPDGQLLRSFDISWVDPRNHIYALAASGTVDLTTGPATNPRIIIVDTRLNVVTQELDGGFAGACSVPPNRDNFSGPNGVIVIEKGRNTDIWAADGPIFNTSCNPASGVKTPSNVKVINLHTGVTKTILTGTPKQRGIRRADELCYNPRSDVVLVANDDPLDNFITFIGEDSLQVVGTINFDGKDPNGAKILANGIEQCQFNPRDGKFYLSLPDIGGGTPGVNGSTGNDGAVVRISGHAPFKVEAVFPIAAATGCLGPQGLAVGPAHQLALGCGGTNSLIIDDRNGGTIAVVAGEGGTDEDWYNPGSNHYYFARSTPAKLGVEDAGPPPAAETPPDVPTASGSHSVAADPIRNQVYVPIRGNAATHPTAGKSTICSSGKDVFGNPGSDALGCIAVFTSPSDADDCIAEGAPVVRVNEDGDPEFLKGRCRDHDRD
jgi:hypothetical protein